MAKKEKITYIDDGRTIADMSGVTGGMPRSNRPKYVPRASFKEQFGTFFRAMRLMFRPMLVVTAGIGLIYVIMYVLFALAK